MPATHSKAGQWQNVTEITEMLIKYARNTILDDFKISKLIGCS